MIRVVLGHRVECVPLPRALAFPSHVLAEFAAGHRALILLNAYSVREGEEHLPASGLYAILVDFVAIALADALQRDPRREFRRATTWFSRRRLFHVLRRRRGLMPVNSLVRGLVAVRRVVLMPLSALAFRVIVER